MRLGLLADIHEHVENLRLAIDCLTRIGIDQFVMLGDVFETGADLIPTCELLTSINAQGVWGNHDFGLCGAVSPQIKARYPSQVLDYFSTLQPRLTLEDCFFQHV